MLIPCVHCALITCRHRHAFHQNRSIAQTFAKIINAGLIFNKNLIQLAGYSGKAHTNDRFIGIDPSASIKEEP